MTTISRHPYIFHEVWDYLKTDVTQDVYLHVVVIPCSMILFVYVHVCTFWYFHPYFISYFSIESQLRLLILVFAVCCKVSILVCSAWTGEGGGFRCCSMSYVSGRDNREWLSWLLKWSSILSWGIINTSHISIRVVFITVVRKESSPITRNVLLAHLTYYDTIV